VDRLLTLTGIAEVITTVDSPEQLLESGHTPEAP
jgi:hypothetical protein